MATNQHIIGASRYATLYTQQTPNNSIKQDFYFSYDPMPSFPSAPEPSAQRKEISSVVIACRQCRSRKIKCDSTRPACNNCIRRSSACEYDPVPKRRGPDKHPGTRQRSCKKRPADGSAPPPKRKRIAKDHEPKEKSAEISQSQPDLHISTNDQVVLVKPESSPLSARHPYPFNYMEAERDAWWQEFTLGYPLEEISADIQYLFDDTSHWLGFLNTSYFQQLLSDPLERTRIQPAFIQAGLAMANLMRSSQTEYGAQGRNRAMWLREAAQVKLEASWNSGWVDHRLAQAALILALFETSSHPEYHPDRVLNSLNFLDNIISRLSLTSLDAHDPDVSLFPQHTVPVVDSGEYRDGKCSCLPADSIRPPDPYRCWTYKLPWDNSWSASQIREEESRRVCWSALGLVANYTAQCAAFDIECPSLYLTDPSNYALLFPAEVLDRVSPTYRAVNSLSQKDSVSALYCRSMLLWCFCNRFSRDSTCPEEDLAEYAQEAWNETQAILDSLNMHVCNLDTSLIYISREYIYNTRIAVTDAFRSLQGLSNRGPVLTRKQAEEWIHYQQQVIKRVTAAIPRITTEEGQMLTRRPYQTKWYFNQLALCLIIWQNDQSLLDALKLAKSFMIAVDVMQALWPSTYNHHQCTEFRNRLTDACFIVGLDPPLPVTSTLPPALHVTM